MFSWDPAEDNSDYYNWYLSGQLMHLCFKMKQFPRNAVTSPLSVCFRQEESKDNSYSSQGSFVLSGV